MSTPQLLALGALAGFTIFLGLPIGRIRSADTRLKAALSAMATGVLLFLLWDVLVHGIEPVEEALNGAVDDGKSWAHLRRLGGHVRRRRVGWPDEPRLLRPLVRPAARQGDARPRCGLGGRVRPVLGSGLSPARWLAVLIATGIGLHNFSEGLAIGQSAAQDQVTLALVLIVGFGLHNATEGFGIVAPLSGADTRPSWRFLGMLGLIGGGPTFIGTLIGQTWVNETVSVAFLALAAGSILYVVMQLMHVNRQLGHKELVAWMLLAGLFLGFATDFIIEAAGV